MASRSASCQAALQVAFYKATWSAAWQDAAYFELARLSSRAGDVATALDLAARALSRNDQHHQARHLQIALLRRSGENEAALATCAAALARDRMEYGALWERFLLAGDGTIEQLARLDA